ncbi:hypothetical protein GGTG_12081 [Gaeumannomyces tritici R3-111a-1]|uniref:DUF1479 domain-containing protein n=1 Tax=Gaeumannomyces tritici (strain R3-111a-1) TaxID=644352 RepID=J3PF02_GAET3|nr:hypothetical protein GGTG_12081 [Gaeumannomyces tritici R3-111a-1]EJT71060.1 hypothetical protein GGTG_12081 [Gaeumannomyces tritici R3-111a-1]
MWPISARREGEGAAGDVKVSLPPQLDLRDRRFQLGSATGSSSLGAGPSATEAQAQVQAQAQAQVLAQAQAHLDSCQDANVPGAAAAVALAAALHAGATTTAEALALGSSAPLAHGAAASARHHQYNHPAASPASLLLKTARASTSAASSDAPPPSSRSSAKAGKQRETRPDEPQSPRGAAAAATAQSPSKRPRKTSSPRPSSPSREAKERRLAKLRRRAAKKAMEPPVLSFYGAKPVPLPSRFATVKRNLIDGHEDAVAASWGRLLDALGREMAAIRAKSSSLELMMGAIDFADIDQPARVAEFSALLKRFGVGVVRGVVPQSDTKRWVDETRRYLETKHDIKPPPPQDPTCFDFFWTPAQIRARAHPHVLRAMKFAMSLWDCESDDRMATRFPINYADRLRIHVNIHAATSSPSDPTPAAPMSLSSPAGPAAGTAKEPPSDREGSSAATPDPAATGKKSNGAGAGAGSSSSPVQPEAHVVEVAAAAAAASAAVAAAATASGTQPIIAQVDGGSLERWEPDGYGRSGTYDSIFRGDWESYDPWDPTGRISATSDLYNGAGACSIFRMFQGLVALTQVQPGMIRLLPSPKLVTAYFLLRPFFSPKTPPPPPGNQEGPEWDAFLAADNWVLDKEQSTIIHGAVPGHAQRVTELWHPHLDLKRTLVTPPNLQAGDYIIWHCETAYTITSSIDSRPSTPGGAGGEAADKAAASLAATAAAAAAAVAAAVDAPRHERFMVYAPACPLTQTNALYLARQRKAFQRGHPGPDFDTTGTGLGTEAPHIDRLGEKEIRDVGGVEALRAMGLAPWDSGTGSSRKRKATEPAPGDSMDVDSAKKAEDEPAVKMEVDEPAEEKPVSSSASSSSSAGTPLALSPAEAELVRLANIILFPDKYEFYMATRHSTPDGGRG